MGRQAIQPGEVGAVTITRRTAKRFAGRVRWRDSRGGYHETTVSAPRESDARRLLAERLEQQQATAEAEGPGADLTLDQAAALWLEGLVTKRGVRESTAAQYAATWRGTLAPVLGSTTVNDLTRAGAQAALDGLVRRDRTGAPVKAPDGSTVPLRGAQPRQVLSMLLRWAADRGHRHDGRNVLEGTQPPLRTKPEPRALTAAEWTRLLALAESAARRHHRATWDLCHALTLVRYTGLRIGEALALQWRDIDLTGKPATLTVARTLLEPRPGVTAVTGPPKGGETRRVALHEEAAWILEMRRSWSAEAKATEFVFAVGKAGRPMSAANLRTRLRALVKDTDLEWIHPHSFRHTLATEAARVTGDASVAGSLLGHTDSGAVAKRFYIERGGARIEDPRALFEDPPEESR